MSKRKVPFKFVLDHQPRYIYEVVGRRASIEDWLADEFRIEPCDPPPFPEREGGKYWVRTGRKSDTVYRFIFGRWWRHVEPDTYRLDLYPDYTLTEQELACIQGLSHRKNWFTKEARQMFYMYNFQQQLRDIALNSGKCKIRLRKFTKTKGLVKRNGKWVRESV